MTDDCNKSLERFQEEEITTTFPSASSINMVQAQTTFTSSPSNFPIENKKQLLDDESFDETEDSFHLLIPSNKLKVRFSSSNPHQEQLNSTTSTLDNNFSLSTTTTIPDSNSTSSCGESTSVKSFHDEEMEDEDDETMIKIPTSASRMKNNFLDDEEETIVDETYDDYLDDEDDFGLSIKTNSTLSASTTNPHIPQVINYSKPKAFLLDSPQIQSPGFALPVSKIKTNSGGGTTNNSTFECSTTPKLNLQNNKHLRNMSDISVYSNMYDDELDPSLISKYFNDGDEVEDDFEYNERLYSRNGGSNIPLFNDDLLDDDDELPNLHSNARYLDQDLSDDEFSSIFLKVNTNIKRQVNKIGGEETKPEAIPTVSNNEDEDLSFIFGKKMKMPRRSSQSGKSNLGLLKFYASREGRNRSISDVSTTIAQIPISQFTRSAITPSNDEMEHILWSSRNSEFSDRHFRMRSESIKLMENLGIDNNFDTTPMKIPESTLERHRIAFLSMYSSSHRAKFQEDSSLVIQSLFRGYVERKKSTKGLVFMSYICTAALGKVNRNRRECAINAIETIQAALLGSQSRSQFHMEKYQIIPIHPISSKSSLESSLSLESNVNNNQEDNVNNISLTHSTCIITSSSSSSSLSDSITLQRGETSEISLSQPFNEEQVTAFQALCRGRVYKLSTQVRNFKINKRIHLLTKSHPLIRETFKCFMDIIVGKWNISNRNHLTFLDQKTTNIITGTHQLYPILLENLYQLVSCNTKNKYWVMRRSLQDLMSESNNTEFEEILEAFNQFSASLKNKTTNESDAETAQMKLLIEFLLDQGNVLPKILMQLMIPEQIYRNAHCCEFFQSPFISNRNSKRSLVMIHSIDAFSTMAKQSYSEKSPMSNDSFASDFAFLCEELSKVFFENNFRSVLFEKRLFQFHSTVCHLLDLLTSKKGELPEKDKMEIYKIILQKLIPYLYSLISLDLAKLDSQSNIKTLWDCIQSSTFNSNLDSAISLTNNMKFITVAIPSSSEGGGGLKRRRSMSSKSLSRSQKTLKLEMSKEKFNLLTSIGLANNCLDQYVSHILQVFSKEKILKTHSPLCAPNIQLSVISAVRSLQLNGNFNNLIVKNE